MKDYKQDNSGERVSFGGIRMECCEMKDVESGGKTVRIKTHIERKERMSGIVFKAPDVICMKENEEILKTEKLN